jgi:type I restriction enzyme S subunit
MTNWKSIPIPDCLVDHKVGRVNQINTADIQPAGEFPVIDQGQAYIAGYSDERDRVIRNGLPYIIFGDHTRCFKYVDFPFVLGADGTKVLKPNSELFDARFFYFAALALDIPSRGYNRHFTLLKEKLIPRPPLDEQRQIAAVLSAVQRATEYQARLIALAAELKKALANKLFTAGTRGEPLKQTEIGPVPENWTVESLGSLFSREPSNGLYRPQSDYGRGTTILRIDDFSNDGDVVTTASNRVDVGEADRSRFGLAKDDIVLNRVNSLSHLGKTALVGRLSEPMLFESNMMRFRVDEQRLRPGFAIRVLNSAICKSQIVGMAKRAVAQSSVNQGDVGRLLIPVPPDVQIQDEILAILDAVEAKSAVHIQMRASLNNLFRTLLHQLMTAQVRVNDLDLSPLENAGG